MNVFMSPIPWGVGDGAFHKRLKLYLDDLGIYAFAFHTFANKPRSGQIQQTNNRGRDFNNKAAPSSRVRSAIVTLPSVEYGQIFLERHGKVGRNRSRNPIRIANTEVPCHEAFNAPTQVHLVYGLVQKQNEEVMRREQRKRERTVVVKQKEKEFPTVSLECGVWNNDPGSNDTTEFVKRHASGRRGILKFRPTCVIIEITSTEELVMDSFGDLEYYVGTPEQKKHLLVIPNHAILSIDTDSRREVYFTLANSPKIYRCTQPIFSEMDPRRQQETRQRVPGINEAHEAFCRISFVYKVVLEDSTAAERIVRLGGRAGIQPINPKAIKTILLQYGFLDDTVRLIRALENSLIYPFPVAYQLHTLFANGTLSPDTVLHLLPEVRKMLTTHRMDPRMVAETIKLFSGRHAQSASDDVIGFGDVLLSPDVNTKENLLDILTEKGRMMRKKGLEWQAEVEARKEKEALVYRTAVTPTGIYSFGPSFEPQNRVLRKYHEYQDYFMRVSFSEEDGEPFQQERDVDSAVIIKLFRERLNHHGEGPIRIAGRPFRFLGFSSSSLKSLTCWFMADFPFEGQIMTPERLIRELGEFGHIETPGRFAARVGQAFSDTMNSIHVDFAQEIDIPDIERYGYDGVKRNFSDGIGKVSRAMVERIWAQSVDLERDQPTVFQIRYGGAKGVIALDDTLTGDKLCLRPSMVKFSGSKDRNIEICSSAGRRGVLTLNRPMIKVLEDLGVYSSTFLSLQKDAVNLLYRSSRSPANAANFFKRQKVSSAILKLPWVIDNLQNVDINFWDDPFLRQGLELALVAALRDYKYRARIPVEKGVTLMGVLDETGFLKEGEVYVSFEKDDGQSFTLKGPALVTRSPQYHPGDCQMVTAVEPPLYSPLRELKNCIAFSQNGDRPLPSMLSGGDLDGDLYNIIWDSRFNLRRSYQPASYPPTIPHSLGRPVTLPDVADFFIDFMQNNLLGMIATRHLIIADQKPEGVHAEECLKLSELASTAVDFPKTGHRVEMSQIPKAPSRARPDFLASGPRVFIRKSSALIAIDSKNPLDVETNEGEDGDFGSVPQVWYLSDKTLGLLYRAIDEQKFVSDIGQNITTLVKGTRFSVLQNIWDYMEYQISKLPPVDGDQQQKQWHNHLQDAQKKREEYIHEMRSIAACRSETPWKSSLLEIEVFMGTVLGKGSSTSSKRQFERVQQLRMDYNVLAEHTVKWLRGESREELIGRAMASLYIALVGERRGLSVEDGGVEGTRSWPWCAVCVLMAEVDQMQKEEKNRVHMEARAGVEAGGARKRAEKVRRKKEWVAAENGEQNDEENGAEEEGHGEKENVRPTAPPAPVIRKVGPYVDMEEFRRQLEAMEV